MSDSSTTISSPQIQGWCPGAWKPMASGDGLVVRVRPPLGRLTSAQILLLSELANAYGAGVVELTSRANVQLRGIAADQHSRVLKSLAEAGLLDADARTERLRNVIVDPLWRADDGVLALAQGLQDALFRSADLDDLPAKFGFSIAGGSHAGLAHIAADVRISRSENSAWLVQPEGHHQALTAATQEQAITAALTLACWCADQSRTRRANGEHPGRLGPLLKAWRSTHGDWPALELPLSVRWVEAPQQAFHEPAPGWIEDIGLLIAAPLGRISANALAQLARVHQGMLRITPWRMLLAENITPQAAEIAGLNNAQDWVITADDPRLRVSACTGAPGCNQALAPTQELALYLASHVPRNAHLHVTGCAKGCARQQPAHITLRAQSTGENGNAFFEVIRNGTAKGSACATLDERSLRDNPTQLFEEEKV